MRVAVVGAGMAGTSLAFHLSAHHHVTLFEAEDAPGYHSTGRSAALYAKSYGNAVIRHLTAACEPFFASPPPGFCDYALLSPRGALFVAHAGQGAQLEQLYQDISATLPKARIIDASKARQFMPALRDSYLHSALWEDDSRDMDVHAIHQGYLRGCRCNGAELRVNAPLNKIERRGQVWRVGWADGAGTFDIVVNAAGAWADSVAKMAGVRSLGIEPKRRTAFLVAPPAGQETASWPITVDVDETFYIKPEAGMLLCSPADETPSPPVDAYPEEIDIATAVDRIQKVIKLPVTRIGRSWAGLRSFAPDRTPVVGFDPHADGFFWLAGQGGYGIQTAPAIAQLACHLLTGIDLGLNIDTQWMKRAMSPDRAALNPEGPCN